MIALLPADVLMSDAGHPRHGDVMQPKEGEQPPRFDGMRALFIDCSLKRSSELSHTDGLIERSAAIMREHGVSVDRIRAEEADLGVDAIDCSTGGISGRERPQGMTLEHGYQLPLAVRVKREAGIATIGVGLLWDPELMDRAIQQGEIDLVALARELLENPNWALHAARELGADKDHQMWHPEFGWWLEKRARALRKLGLRR